MATRDPKLKLGPFWAAMRSAERGIYVETLLAADDDVSYAAELLQVSRKWFTQRSKYLGGVFKEDPVNEPPRDLIEPPDPNAPRRGRPPNKKPDDDDGDDDGDDYSEDHDDGDDDEGVEAAPEEVAPEEAAPEEAVELEPQPAKRGRGRPRKGT